MKTYELLFCGRKLGAIGISYALPPVTVDADTLDEAKEKARMVLADKYEHCHFSGAREVSR